MTKPGVQAFAIPLAHTWLGCGPLPSSVTHPPNPHGLGNPCCSWSSSPHVWLPGGFLGAMAPIVFPTVDARGQEEPFYRTSEPGAQLFLCHQPTVSSGGCFCLRPPK